MGQPGNAVRPMCCSEKQSEYGCRGLLGLQEKVPQLRMIYLIPIEHSHVVECTKLKVNKM